MSPHRPVSWVACTLVSVGLLVFVSPATAGNAAMRECVERGGTYLENGTCDVSETPARRCKRLGGRYVGNGRCEFEDTEDPIDRCRQDGGVLMHQGRCYVPPSP